MAEREKFSIAKPFVYLALCGYLAVVVYPMLWLLYTSLKTDREIFLNPFSLPEIDALQWINFTNAWTKGHFGDYFFNSVFLTISTVAVSMLLAAMAAYALARFNFFGVRPMFFYFLAGLMIPLQLSIVPLFFQMKDFGLLNSRLGILIVYVAFGMPFAIFILTGFFKSLPSGLHESALIDGAGEFRAFWSIMLPLARPGLITVGIFAFFGDLERVFHGFYVPVWGGVAGVAHAAVGAGQHYYCQSVSQRLGHGFCRVGADYGPDDVGVCFSCSNT